MKKFATLLGGLAVATAIATGPAQADVKVAPRYTDIVAAKGHEVAAASVARAFSECSAQRGWKFSANGPGRLIGQLIVRGKHFVAVDVEYNAKAYKISYRDSKNMKYDAARQTIHKRYASWVENLDNDIRFCLK